MVSMRARGSCGGPMRIALRCCLPVGGSPMSNPPVPTFANGWQQATRYPDPAIVALDPAFEKYWLKLSCVERIATGFRWAEGPVWFGDGRYLLWSDVPGNGIYKWEEE